MSIEGIMVLSQTELFHRPGWVPIVIILLFCAVIGFMFYGVKDMMILPFIAALIVFLGCAGLTIEYAAGHFNFYTGKYEYECLISEEVNMAEVYDKYEVIRRDGEIWVLEDKE